MCLLEQCASQAERDALAQRFLTINDPSDVESIRQLVVDKGGVDLALTEAKAAVAHAKEQLVLLPPGLIAITSGSLLILSLVGTFSMASVIILAGAPRVALDAVRFLTVNASGATASRLASSLRAESIPVTILASPDAPMRPMPFATPVALT